ncbi:MAG TPA: alpha/beta hydrolase [Acidimicrobiales bacterium]|nr:alpha/beta hydrolase [Acidimicrobiales bacterium]
MPDLTPTIVLVHGAFAESASWAPVVEELRSGGLRVVAAANPLRSLAGDAAYVRDVIGGLGDPVVLVGHSYGGMVVTQAAAGNASVLGLVYVAGFAPEQGESALGLARRFPGSTLADALVAYPVAAGGVEVAIRQEDFHQQFAADVPEAQAAVMAATQRPVTRVALAGGLLADPPAWRELPSWFVFGDGDLVVPVEAHRYMAERAAAKVSRELAGASHVLSLSEPDAVTATILEATASL